MYSVDEEYMHGKVVSLQDSRGLGMGWAATSRYIRIGVARQC